MITIIYQNTEVQTHPRRAHIQGRHSFNHIIIDAEDKDAPEWEAYERDDLRPRLSWHGSVLTYPSIEAYELLCAASGLELPKNAPLSFWEDVIKALSHPDAIPDRLESTANKHGYTFVMSSERWRFDPIDTSH